MQKEIKVVVQVSDNLHAKIIMEEIKKLIKNRTVVWFVGEPETPKRFIDDLYSEQAVNSNSYPANQGKQRMNLQMRLDGSRE